MIELHLPLPPSANGIWRNVKGRTLASAKYRAWKVQAAVAILKQDVNGWDRETISHPIAVSIDIKCPRRGCDLDNRIKPILDALESFSVIEDDNQVHDLRARWADVNGAVVRIEELKG